MTRLNLEIDIFSLEKQRANALATLTPPELVEAILQEFRELEFLGDDPSVYQLQRVDNNTPLDDTQRLEAQIKSGTHLRLVECSPQLPANAQPMPGNLYLRELSRGKVYKLHWQPAIIGRYDAKMEHNELLAVDLAGYDTDGKRVSRRHARISADSGDYLIESLADNPTVIKNQQGERLLQRGQRVVLQPGDKIYLENSGIGFVCLVRAAGTPQ